MAFAACSPAPQPVAKTPSAESPDPTGGLAPPLVLPGVNTGSISQEPSYEVSIASVAAIHNKALERCTQQPESVRTQCEQAANAAFSDARERLEPLRGNQE